MRVFNPEAVHRIHDRRLQHSGLHDACRLSLRVTANGKQMLRQKSGSIINVSTSLVDQPIAGLEAAVQIMVKGALNAVTRALAIEYATAGIRINTIATGVIDTPMNKPETHDFLKTLHPVGRIGEVKEVVDAALFLTDATFTSGEILHVDGGAHAGKW
jgi:NAD(P)-dependent dehydrogenase (short-subunit alcohol dehydrogenase family)